MLRQVSIQVLQGYCKVSYPLAVCYVLGVGVPCEMGKGSLVMLLVCLHPCCVSLPMATCL
jgi:hypothetical protein